MAFFITVIVGDLRDISFRALTIALFLFLAFCSLSSISSHCDGATVLSVLSIPFSLVFPLFLFFFGFFLGFSSLFGLVGLILELRGCAGFLGLFRLIVLRIEAYFQGLLSFEVLLI